LDGGEIATHIEKLTCVFAPRLFALWELKNQKRNAESQHARKLRSQAAAAFLMYALTS
jgi:hypothetical protein